MLGIPDLWNVLGYALALGLALSYGDTLISTSAIIGLCGAAAVAAGMVPN